MSEIATQTLELVGREINATVGEARAAVEAFVEQPDNVSLLERVTADMHQVQGVLRLLEIYGAALLAEEMEQVTRYLVATSAERKNQAEALDALLRALVQLPGYLERVIAGGRDLALVLLPLLNDLRAVRGSPLLSEGTLLLLNLKSDRQATPVAPAPGEQPLTIEQWAPPARAFSGRAHRLDSWRAHRSESRDPRGGRTQARAGSNPPAGFPAVVGHRGAGRGAARAWHRRRRVHKAAARTRRPRGETAL